MLRLERSALLAPIKELLLSWAGRLARELHNQEVFFERVTAARSALFAGWSILQVLYLCLYT